MPAEVGRGEPLSRAERPLNRCAQCRPFWREVESGRATPRPGWFRTPREWGAWESALVEAPAHPSCSAGPGSELSQPRRMASATKASVVRRR